MRKETYRLVEQKWVMYRLLYDMLLGWRWNSGRRREAGTYSDAGR
jgi:hypothetical protein